ncbi:hypothetical protein [Vibrio harveyi]|uniref:hypothetical protein n=1 Tax=Vibrio harveyi TaxID=669 RepID=UPI002480F6EE|nr:hypothetical protein [Vibrio harveyi]
MNATISNESLYTTFTNTPNVLFVFNPTGELNSLSQDEILSHVGIIPSFITTRHEQLESQVLHAYGFPRSPMKGTAKDGVYSSEFADDPDLHAYAKIVKLSAEGALMLEFFDVHTVIAKYAVETLDVFPYGICVFTKSDNTQKTYRLD